MKRQLFALFFAVVACGDRSELGSPDAGGRPDAGDNNDGGAGPAEDRVVACDNDPIPTSNAVCDFLTGTNGATLIRADVVGPDALYQNGQVLINASGQVACAGCDCQSEAAFADAARLNCANGVVAPASINAHDHITFTETPPTPPPSEDERYDHRHDWRTGRNGGTEIRSVRNQSATHGVWWGELRQLMAGTTAINGSGAQDGLLRNLDRANQEGLDEPAVFYSTFPLDDISGRTRNADCSYDGFDSPDDNRFQQSQAYTPHIAEGIDQAARNEFICQSGGRSDGVDIMTDKTAVIHGIGLTADDWALMGARQSGLIWSARTNIDLYGITADVITAAQSGVQIALGTDWTATGSMNILRELRCVDSYNRDYLDGFFSDRSLVDMATKNAAGVLRIDDRLGVLAPGREADITIYNASTRDGYRSIIEADPQDISLVMRSGVALYGDDVLIDALVGTDAGCESIDVCGSTKRVCSEQETGFPLSTHRAEIAANAYELFYCDTPPMEPTCVPFRPGEFMGASTNLDADGDGAVDSVDNCPTVFNPIRPVDNGQQSDTDLDGLGDACDPCP
ncbi:MAG: amidohydrolase family protein, partial [Myxococcota bacterium]